MNVEIKRIKENLFSEIKNIKIDGLISISLIGSFQYTKKLEKVNDVDLIVLVKKLTPESYEDIKNKFYEIAKSLSNDKIKFLIETKRGPIKPSPIKEKIVIQLHLLIHFLSYWKKIEGAIDFDSINFNMCLKGKELYKVTPLPRLKREWVLNDFQMHRNNLQKSKIRLLEWGEEKGKLIRKELEKELSLEEKCEGVVYAIISSFLNFLRYYNPKLIKNKELLLAKGKKILPKEYFEILKEAFDIKEKMRNGKEILKPTIQELQKNALKFINFLETEIKK